MTHDTEGKYITLDELKEYGIGTVADPLNPTVYNSAVQGSPDDGILRQCIHRAEMEVDRISGVQFNEQTVTNALAFRPFVDTYGYLNMYAREACPVTEITSLEVRDLMKPGTSWATVGLVAENIILPTDDGYAHPDSALVRVWHNDIPKPRSSGQIMVRWSYAGGFTVIPKSFKAMVCRLAWWIYKLREAPMSSITLPGLGVINVPLSIPKDINSDILLWQPSFE